MTQEKKQYIIPTPGGAYYLAQDNSSDWKKDVLKKLFSKDESIELNHENLMTLFNENDEDELKQKLDECENLQLLQVIDSKLSAPVGTLEENLNDIIQTFSKKSHALLSDSQGFCIANKGFPNEMSEEISVLSADIAIMHKRRAMDINHKLNLKSQAWAIVDASGNSSLGFWPINIGDEVFVLALEGVPFFNQQSMVALVWLLYLRYGKNK